MSRVAISKFLRFEVFKRDKFTCTYCGCGPSEAIMHVDHVIPLAEGGTSDFVNLTTACLDCNLGKGARKLSDDTVAKKNFRQLEELEERRQQNQMIVQWRQELLALDEEAARSCAPIIQTLFGCDLLDNMVPIVTNHIIKHGLESVIGAMEALAKKRVSFAEAVAKIPLQIKWDKMPEEARDFKYMCGVLHNLGCKFTETLTDALSSATQRRVPRKTLIELAQIAASKKDRDVFIRSLQEIVPEDHALDCWDRSYLIETEQQEMAQQYEEHREALRIQERRESEKAEKQVREDWCERVEPIVSALNKVEAIRVLSHSAQQLAVRLVLLSCSKWNDRALGHRVPWARAGARFAKTRLEVSDVRALCMEDMRIRWAFAGLGEGDGVFLCAHGGYKSTGADDEIEKTGLVKLDRLKDKVRGYDISRLLRIIWSSSGCSEEVAHA